MAVNFKVNGVLTRYPSGSTISDVVARLAVMSRTVQVSRNGQEVPVPDFASIVLSEDDQVDVHFP